MPKYFKNFRKQEINGGYYTNKIRKHKTKERIFLLLHETYANDFWITLLSLKFNSANPVLTPKKQDIFRLLFVYFFVVRTQRDWGNLMLNGDTDGCNHRSIVRLSVVLHRMNLYKWRNEEVFNFFHYYFQFTFTIDIL